MSDCRSCGTKLVWATTVPADPAKKPSKIPLDATPVDPLTNSGALACVGADDALFAYGRKLLSERMSEKLQVPVDEARRQAIEKYQWRVPHFTTCPQADEHRNPR